MKERILDFILLISVILTMLIYGVGSYINIKYKYNETFIKNLFWLNQKENIFIGTIFTIMLLLFLYRKGFI